MLPSLSGFSYKDQWNNPNSFERILRNNGCNLARIRVWTNSNWNQYSLQYGLQLAQRAKNVGMDIYVDLHYSDTCE